MYIIFIISWLHSTCVITTSAIRRFALHAEVGDQHHHPRFRHLWRML